MSRFRASGKWKSDGPSRTNTGSSVRGRIGPPIPIPDDDEFPIRTPGAGIATPLSAENAEQQVRLRTSTAPDLAAPVIEQIKQAPPGIAMSDFTEPAESASLAIPSSDESLSRRTLTPSAQRTSTTTAPSKSSMPQRKKSSLKSVLGRLFGGKKRKSDADSIVEEKDPGGVRVGQHRSDPSALTKAPKSSSSQKRSASLPINEYNRALRSHSISAGNGNGGFIVPHDTLNTNRDSGLSTQPEGEGRSRRATTPSRLWTPSNVPAYGANWTGLSPRPASSQAKGSRVVSATDGEGIGMAVTSGSHPNRRSRSVGELRAITSGHLMARRRSDEIRYWRRESYDPGVISPLSSTRPEEPFLPDEEEQVESEEPPQPFNFGPMGEMAGMKITQAASLETRVHHLESRVQDMEQAVRRLYRQLSTDSLIQLQDSPKRYKGSSIPRPTTGTSEISLPRYSEPRHRALDTGTQSSKYRSSSYGSSRPATIDINNVTQLSSFNSLLVSVPPENSTATSSQTTTARPLSTSTTIRGIPSCSPTMSKDSFTAEQFSQLKNFIISEQSARHQLEALVKTLQLQVQTLKLPNGVISASHTKVTGNEFSNFEQDENSDDEAPYADEAFQTPIEEKGHFDDNDTFGDVMGDVPKSRTMSLSQMTLGKGMQRV